MPARRKKNRTESSTWNIHALVDNWIDGVDRKLLIFLLSASEQESIVMDSFISNLISEWFSMSARAHSESPSFRLTLGYYPIYLVTKYPYDGQWSKWDQENASQFDKQTKKEEKNRK